MTTDYTRSVLPTYQIPDRSKIEAGLGVINYPSKVPPVVVEFVVGHAGDRKNVEGIMNIINATLGTWMTAAPDHDWDHAVQRTSLLPEIALAVAPNSQLALEGLFLVTRR